MKLGTLDIIGDPSIEPREGLQLCLAHVISDDMFVVTLDADQTEHLITYLKGLRDGMGWNKKAAADRSL